MNKNLERRDNESFLSYIERITENRKLYDADYSERAENLVGKTYSSENARKAYYIVEPLIKKLKEEKIESITDEEILNELEMKRIEVLKERRKKQAINAEFNRLVRRQADTELYWEKFYNAVESLEPLKFPEPIEIDCCKREYLLAISDLHYAKEIKVHGLKNDIINEYNIDVFEKRMWDLQNQVVDVIKEKNIKKLHIFTLGDCIDGILRMSQLMSLQEGVVDSVIQFSEFMGTWMNELTNRVPILLEYDQCWGNHDQIRSLQPKRDTFIQDNVSKLIMKFLKLRVQGNKNIKINESKTPLIYKNILGVDIVGFHGEDKNLELATKFIRSFYNVDVDMVLCGHLHSQSLVTEGVGKKFGDVQCIRVPSICGVDDYSLTLKKSARAGAMLFTFEDGKGKIETRDFWLN